MSHIAHRTSPSQAVMSLIQGPCSNDLFAEDAGLQVGISSPSDLGFLSFERRPSVNTVAVAPSIPQPYILHWWYRMLGKAVSGSRPSPLGHDRRGRRRSWKALPRLLQWFRGLSEVSLVKACSMLMGILITGSVASAELVSTQVSKWSKIIDPGWLKPPQLAETR